MSMINWRLIAKVVGVLILLFVVAQVLIVGVLEKNPPVSAEPAWDSSQTRALAERACFDCHSNETAWPLYTRLTPASLLVTFDVLRGRRHLNFSEWDKPREAEEGEHAGPIGHVVAEHIYEGEMPPANYMMLHPEARLSDREKDALVAGLQASLK